MANTALAPVTQADELERVLIGGDLEKLSSEQRIVYYQRVCASVGLNPLTQPFEYLRLSGKLRLYARKDATDQLRTLHSVSVESIEAREVAGVYVVTCKVRDGKGRSDVATGAVAHEGLKGESLANAIMKAETKAKRRATLSICGLGMLDETEVEDIPARDKAAPSYTPPAVVATETRPMVKAAPPPPVSPAPPKAAAAAVPAPAVTSTTPAAPGVYPVPTDAQLFGDRQLAATVDQLRRLILEKPPAGLGWHVKHAQSWLKKYFGVNLPTELRLGQARDAECLVRTLLKGEAGVEEYKKILAVFCEESRVLTNETDK